MYNILFSCLYPQHTGRDTFSGGLSIAGDEECVLAARLIPAGYSLSLPPSAPGWPRAGLGPPRENLKLPGLKRALLKLLSLRNETNVSLALLIFFLVYRHIGFILREDFYLPDKKDHCFLAMYALDLLLPVFFMFGRRIYFLPIMYFSLVIDYMFLWTRGVFEALNYFGGWRKYPPNYLTGDSMIQRLFSEDCHSVLNPSMPEDTSEFCRYAEIIINNYVDYFSLMQFLILPLVLISVCWYCLANIRNLKSDRERFNMFCKTSSIRNLTRVFLAFILSAILLIPYLFVHANPYL